VSTKANRTSVRFALLVLALAIASAFILYPREQRYQGKTFSQSLIGFSTDGFQLSADPPYRQVVVYRPSAERGQAEEALDHFANPDFTTLAGLAGAKDTVLTPVWVWINTKLSFLKLQPSTASEKQSQAVAAFMHYRSRAASAVPDLLALLHDQRTPRPALYSLAFIGSDPDHQVTTALTNFLARPYAPYLRMDAIATLAELGQKAPGAVPMLNICLGSGDRYESAMAAVALIRLGVHTSDLAEFITQRLRTAPPSRRYSAAGYSAAPAEMYLWALGNCGEDARDSLAVIAQFTNSPAPEVRQRALEAIDKITKTAGARIESSASPPH
jgi:hypothetical protein